MKAILVIDAKNCLDCPLGEYIDTHTIRCRDSGEYAPLKKGMHRLKGCRLRPMPARKLLLVPNSEEQNVKLNRIWDDGWNACLDAIEGETE